MHKLTDDEKISINNIISKIIGVNIGKVLPSANIKNDLCADSLDIVEIIMTTEEEFNIVIPDNTELYNIHTVNDYYECVEKQFK
jgi:acyl carrier protein